MIINPTPITGDHSVDVAIAKWIKGLEDELSVQCKIIDAQYSGTIPFTDSEGRHWSSREIMDYALMITPHSAR